MKGRVCGWKRVSFVCLCLLIVATKVRVSGGGNQPHRYYHINKTVLLLLLTVCVRRYAIARYLWQLKTAHSQTTSE